MTTGRPHELIASVLSKDEPLFTLDIIARIRANPADENITRFTAILWEMVEEGTIRWHEQGGVVLR